MTTGPPVASRPSRSALLFEDPVQDVRRGRELGTPALQVPGTGDQGLPSGMIEDRESPAEGASRELAEETGLVVLPGDLVLQSTSTVRSADKVSQAWNFSVVVHDPTLRVDDPDELIQEARWFTTEEAMRLLRELPYRPLSEPALSILEGQVEPGAHWAYSDPRSRPSVTRQE